MSNELIIFLLFVGAFSVLFARIYIDLSGRRP